MNFLREIVSQKRAEVEETEKELALHDLKELVRFIRPPNDFKAAITRREGQPVKVIAEIKRASPSRGVIAENFDPEGLAREYSDGGASAISILTEKNYFKGSSLDLQIVRRSVPKMPLLRKDFIVDEYQIYESLRMCADAILLICAILDESKLEGFMSTAKSLQLSSLVEVHDERELEMALTAGADIIGVNNRDLETFEVSTSLSRRLGRKIPEGVVSVCESGISDISGLHSALEFGYHAVLVGEHFMRAEDRLAEVRKFSSCLKKNGKLKARTLPGIKRN